MTGPVGFLVAHVGRLYHKKSLLVCCVSRYKRDSKVDFESRNIVILHLLGPAKRHNMYDISVSA